MQVSPNAEIGAVIKILGISGSLRSASYNTALLQAAASLVDAPVELDTATLHGIPLYDGDLEASSGLPDAVINLKSRVRASDGLLLVTPEYNNGIPGVFKNAIDWMSRPGTEPASVFADRPVAVMGASPGGFGTILSQNHWLPVLRTLRMRPWFGGRLMVSEANTVFDAAGAIKDDALRTRLRDFLRGYAEFIGE